MLGFGDPGGGDTTATSGGGDDPSLLTLLSVLLRARPGGLQLPVSGNLSPGESVFHVREGQPWRRAGWGPWRWEVRGEPELSVALLTPGLPSAASPHSSIRPRRHPAGACNLTLQPREPPTWSSCWRSREMGKPGSTVRSEGRGTLTHPSLPPSCRVPRVRPLILAGQIFWQSSPCTCLRPDYTRTASPAPSPHPPAQVPPLHPRSRLLWGLTHTSAPCFSCWPHPGPASLMLAPPA